MEDSPACSKVQRFSSFQPGFPGFNFLYRSNPPKTPNPAPPTVHTSLPKSGAPLAIKATPASRRIIDMTMKT